MLPLDLMYTLKLLVHHHQWCRIQRQHILWRHQRLIQVVEQLKARILDQLIFIEDSIIIDLRSRRAEAINTCNNFDPRLEPNILPVGQHGLEELVNNQYLCRQVPGEYKIGELIDHPVDLGGLHTTKFDARDRKSTPLNS